jgi:hypothetical protein
VQDWLLTAQQPAPRPAPTASAYETAALPPVRTPRRHLLGFFLALPRSIIPKAAALLPSGNLIPTVSHYRQIRQEEFIESHFLQGVAERAFVAHDKGATVEARNSLELYHGTKRAAGKGGGVK